VTSWGLVPAANWILLIDMGCLTSDWPTIDELAGHKGLTFNIRLQRLQRVRLQASGPYKREFFPLSGDAVMRLVADMPRSSQTLAVLPH